MSAEEIKAMLDKGMTPEQITEVFAETLAEAKKAKDGKDDRITAAKKNLCAAMKEFYLATGQLDESDWDEDAEELVMKLINACAGLGKGTFHWSW